MGAEAFFAELAARDPESGQRLRPSDTQRTLRAMEVLEATGRPLSYWQSHKGEPVLAGLPLARFVLSPPRPALHAAINARFEAMLEQGALEEAKALAGLDPALPAAKILGLRPLQALAAGEMTPRGGADPGPGRHPPICQAPAHLVPPPHGRLDLAGTVTPSNILPEILSHLA